MWLNNLIATLFGIVLGVLLNDPLIYLRDYFIHKYKRIFYKRPNQLSKGDSFSFGGIQTSWIVIDGDGEEAYTPKNIITHFDSRPVELPIDLLKRKNEIQKGEEVKREKGESFQWNGSRYSLDKFSLGRSDDDENISLQLWFRPTDFYTFLATNLSLDSDTLRSKYIQNINWVTEFPRYFSNDFAIYLTIVSRDEYTILPKRSASVAVYPDTFTISLTEGLSRSLDRGTTTLAPDLYRTAIRGIAEELGITDTPISNISFLSFGVNTKYVQPALLGVAKIDKTMDEILQYRTRGVRDKWENSEFDIVKFDLNSIVGFVFSHNPWAPGSLACLYHALVHEFGKTKTNKIITSYHK